MDDSLKYVRGQAVTSVDSLAFQWLPRVCAYRLSLRLPNKGGINGRGKSSS